MSKKAGTRKGKWGSAAVHAIIPAAMLSLAAVAGPVQSGKMPKEPMVMSALKVEGLEGFAVRDSTGAKIGEVERVETDFKGRTRYVHLVLNDGREARVAAFRATLDPSLRRVDLALPRYVVERSAAPGAVMVADVQEQRDPS